jgi:hypothetical protein
MSQPRDARHQRERDQRRTRWPLLTVGLVLIGLFALTSTLERSAPSLSSSAPLVAGLPDVVLEAPITCTRAIERAQIDGLARELRSEGRITSAMVFACPRLFDRRPVVYVGEIVGDVLVRDGGAWVQVNDDAYALEVGPFGAHREQRGFSSGLAVWLPDGLHEQLGAPGRHGRRGDVVLVRGILRRADPADGGGITVRATELEVLAAAVEVEEPLHADLAVAATVAALLAVATTLWARTRRRRNTV